MLNISRDLEPINPDKYPSISMSTKIKYGLSAAVLALISASASAPQILDQFLNEKEGNHTTAYRDGSGIWTICRGATMVDGKPVIPGMKLSKEKMRPG